MHLSFLWEVTSVCYSFKSLTGVRLGGFGEVRLKLICNIEYTPHPQLIFKTRRQ